MRNLFNSLTVVSAILLVLFVLIQSRGQSLGATFGGDTNFYRSKRGAEAVIFNATIVFAVIFVLSVILSILSKK
jgi:preprotein translocase subunit SecG